MNFYLGLKTLAQNLTSWKAPSTFVHWVMMSFTLQKLRGVQMKPKFCSINPAMVAPYNLNPVYIKGAMEQKCEIQRNLTNTVQLRRIKFIASRASADKRGIQVSATVATPTVIHQAFVDIWSKIMNV